MSGLVALARAQAVATGAAQPVSLVRHVHVAKRPLVLVALTLAGEANAPLAAMVGDDPETGRLLVVPQPRNRDQRFAFAAELAQVMVGYIESFQAHADLEEASGRGGERRRFADAPQLLVPNPATAGFVRLRAGRPGSAGRPASTPSIRPFPCSAGG